MAVSSVDLWGMVIEMSSNFVKAMSGASFYVQTIGELSEDGLGKTWQSNVFGHYSLFRLLEPLLVKSATVSGARVIWISSQASDGGHYSPNDWQCRTTRYSYEVSKYQLEVVSRILDRRSTIRTPSNHSSVRHITVLPGVAKTCIIKSATGIISGAFAFILMCMARLLGSRIHLISPYKAAVSTVEMSFEQLSTPESQDTEGDVSFQYRSELIRWSTEEVVKMKFRLSHEKVTQAEELLELLEELYHYFCLKFDMSGSHS